jgi:hypothetical protein
MSFGRNPHVAKAQAEEQKALATEDEHAASIAWREAARQWDRAAAREADAKRKQEYEAKAEAARANADGDGPAPEEDAPVSPRLLN